ncbi:MAG: transposase [Bacteroidia bacterium]
MMEYPRFYKRNLPHWQPEGVSFHVVYRLFGTLPRKSLIEIQEKRDRILDDYIKLERTLYEKFPDGVPPEMIAELYFEKRLIHEEFFDQIENLLDKAIYGPTWLQQANVAEIVRDSLHFMESQMKSCEILAYCIMPNHVHLIIREIQPVLHVVMKSHKQFTARQANVLLGRTGNYFWQKESYDHIIRNEEELEHHILYVLNNPVKAGLVTHWEDWPYTYLKQ